jgi:hypothetical protein
MASSNVQRVYESLVAYRQGDQEKLRQMVHPDLESYGAPGIVNAGTYHGFDGYLQWVGEWEEAWYEASYELGDLVEVDESVIVAPVHVVGRGAASGIEIDTTFGWLYQWDDDLLIRFQVHPSFDEARAAGERLAAERT